MIQSTQPIQFACQSCGMPLQSEEQFGTDQDHNKTQEYCIYCYEQGAFKQPDLTMEEMVEVCVPFLVEEGMEEQAARSMMQACLPHLKRWSGSQGIEGAEEHARHTVRMEPYAIVEREAFTLVGITTRTTNSREFTADGAIPALWNRFWQEQTLQALVQSADSPEPGILYGCYYNYENQANGEYTVMIGTSANSEQSTLAEMETVHVPAAKYAVFTTERGPFGKVVADAWQAVWALTAASGIERTYTGDFERYDERCQDPENAVVELYIAIK